MSDKLLPIPPRIVASQLLDSEFMERLNRASELALKNQLNKNDSDPRLKALEMQWKTMDRFSKRELGDAKTPVKPAQSPTVTAQLAPGQTATITGPATIQGGDVKINSPGETKT